MDCPSISEKCVVDSAFWDRRDEGGSCGGRCLEATEALEICTAFCEKGKARAMAGCAE